MRAKTRATLMYSSSLGWSWWVPPSSGEVLTTGPGSPVWAAAGMSVIGTLFRRFGARSLPVGSCAPPLRFGARSLPVGSCAPPLRFGARSLPVGSCAPPLRFGARSLDQVHEREDHDPDDVHEVPVQADQLDRLG